MGSFERFAAAIRREFVFFALVFLLAGPCIEAEEPRRLTDDGTLKFAPTFVTDEAIVFAVHQVPNEVVLKRLDLKDHSQKRVHPNIAAHQWDPAYSNDGRLHAYSRSSASPQMVLVILNLEGKTESVYQPRESRAVARGACFSADSKRVFFHTSDVNGYQIASVDVTGGNFQLVTHTAGISAWPAVSPDGSHLAFSSSRDGNFEIYSLDLIQGTVQRLTESAGLDTRPNWSPDGSRIAFTSNRDGNYEIYVMGSDGSHLRRLTNHPDRDDWPVWHPDGVHLLTVSQRSGKSDLYLHSVGD